MACPEYAVGDPLRVFAQQGGDLLAQPGVLHDILGIAAAAQPPVQQAEKAGAVGLQGGFGVHATNRRGSAT